MSLSVGKVVLGRYALREELPGTTDLWRWAATDQATGREVEVVAPRLMAALRPGASERFRAAGQTPQGFDAFLPRLAEGLEGSLPVAVRARTLGPWPRELRLDGPLIEEVAAWLAPAVLASGTAFGEGLRPEDIALDEQGVPRLAPLGLVHSGSVSEPAPHRPPENLPGDLSDPEGALYGLGALLYRAATGQDPAPASVSWTDVHGWRARDLRPDLSQSADNLLAALLSGDPAKRRRMAECLPTVWTPRVPLNQSEPGPAARGASPGAFAPLPSPTAAARAPAPTPPQAARPDVGLAPWVVAVRPADLRPAALRRAAALAGAWTSALAAAGQGGHWVPVAEAQTKDEAQARARALADLGVPTRVLPGQTAWGRGLAAVLTFFAGACLTLLGLLLLPMVLVGLVVLLGAAALGASALGVARVQRSARQGKSALVQATASPGAEARLATVRRRLLELDLAGPVRDDLVTALDALEERLASADQAEVQVLLEAAARIDASARSVEPARAIETESLEARLRAARAAASETGPQT